MSPETSCGASAGAPEVGPRVRGPRNFDEIPSAELAQLMARLRAAGCTGDEALFRAVVDHCELARMTEKVRARLEEVRAGLA